MQAIDDSSLSSLDTLLRSMGMDEDGTLLRYGVWHIWLVDGLR
jgi:hypothetical protein